MSSLRGRVERLEQDHGTISAKPLSTTDLILASKENCDPAVRERVQWLLENDPRNAFLREVIRMARSPEGFVRRHHRLADLERGEGEGGDGSGAAFCRTDD